MNINEATKQFEKWMRKKVPLPPGPDGDAIKFKQTAIAQDGDTDGSKSAFPFLRATFYRWAQRWKKEAKELGKAPVVLAIGDLHIENFGTWRDEKGRLIWGINDFDEAWELPWTSDLVRLGVSASLAVKQDGFGLKTEELCELLLDGYREGLKENAIVPFTLGAEHERLLNMIKRAFKKVDEFWKPFDDPGSKWKPITRPPPGAKAALLAVSPPGAKIEGYREQAGPYEAGKNEPAGLGSLGRPRYSLVARIDHPKPASIDMERFVREAKAVLPSAMAWVLKKNDAKIQIGPLLTRARPSPDPAMQLLDGWIARRIAPDAVKVSLKKLKKDGFESEDQQTLFQAMGRETANVHLASGLASDILDDLRKRKNDDKEWFEKAVKDWREKVKEDWRDFDPKVSAS